MKKQLFLFLLFFICNQVYTQIIESSDLDNNKFLYAGKDALLFKKELTQDSLFYNALKERLTYSFKKGLVIENYVTNLNHTLEHVKMEVDPKFEKRMQTFFEKFSATQINYYYCGAQCAPFFNQELRLKSDTFIIDFGRKNYCNKGRKHVKKAIIIFAKNNFEANEKTGFGPKLIFNEIKNAKTQFQFAEFIEKFNNKNFTLNEFKQFASLTDSLKQNRIVDYLKDKLERGGNISSSGKDYYTHKTIRESNANRIKGNYGFTFWIKDAIITNIDYIHPVEQTKEVISLDDLKMYTNFINSNAGFHILQQFGYDIFKNKITSNRRLPTGYKIILQPYLKQSTEAFTEYEFLNQTYASAMFLITLKVSNKTNKVIFFNAEGLKRLPLKNENNN